MKVSIKTRFSSINAFVRTMLVFVFASNISMGASQVIIDTDFGKNLKPIAANYTQKGQISGVLPTGWEDNSAWAQITVDYKKMQQDAMDFLRMDVSKLGTGRAHLVYKLPGNPSESFYRLSFTARRSGQVPVQIGVRSQDRPYTFLWETKPVLLPNWKQFNYEFSLAAGNRPISLMFIVYGEDSLDLMNCKLEKFDRQNLVDQIKARFPSGSPANLLRISRFPLGIQSGWTMFVNDSDQDEVRISGDSNTIGPSGYPSMRMQCLSKRAGLYSAPFQIPYSFEKHTASFWVMGQAKGSLLAVAGPQTLGQKQFEITRDRGWQRIELIFEPMLLGKMTGLKFEWQGEMWVDAMQVESGTKASSYKSQMPVEVSLALPESDASVARIQFADEKPKIKYYVSGPAKNAILKIKVIDLYGQTQNLKDVKLANERINTGEFKYPVPETHPYGAFRIEACVEIETGTMISTFNELVVNRMIRPHYWGKDAPNSPFGVHTYHATRHLLMSKAMGMNWVRLHNAGRKLTWWYWLEPQKGHWLFNDEAVTAYRNHNLMILGMLATAPKWASHWQDVQKNFDSYMDCWYLPKNDDDWVNYVRTVVSRYKSSIGVYDFWNEPWVPGHFAIGYNESDNSKPKGYYQSADPGQDFCRLSKITYEIVKSIGPNIKLLGLQTGDADKDTDRWGSSVVRNGGLNTCDIFCYHQYNAESVGFPGDAVDRGYRHAMGPVLQQTGKNAKPVWMTEGSPLGQSIGTGFYNYTLPSQDVENVWISADRIPRYFVSMFSAGVERVFLYSIEDWQYFGCCGLYRVLTTEDGYPHPTALAMSAAAWMLEDCKFVKQVSPHRDVYAYIFRGDRHLTAVLCPKSKPENYKLAESRSFIIRDLFGNKIKGPVDVDGTCIYITSEKSISELETYMDAK